MTTQEEKHQRWQEMHTRVMHMTDRLGKHVDPGIVETVVVLNLHGISTRQSCEGHLDHGTRAPWVDVRDMGIVERQDEVVRMFQRASQMRQQQGNDSSEAVQLYQEAQKAAEEVKRQNLVIRRTLMNYLAAFYEPRHVPFDVRLVIQARGYGESRLESQGADFQETALPEMRESKLAEYQQEMQAFTAFLKERYVQR